MYLCIVALRDFSLLFFLRIPCLGATFLCLAAGEMSLANTFVSLGRGVHVCPYCYINIASYTVFAHGKISE